MLGERAHLRVENHASPHDWFWSAGYFARDWLPIAAAALPAARRLGCCWIAHCGGRPIVVCAFHDAHVAFGVVPSTSTPQPTTPARKNRGCGAPPVVIRSPRTDWPTAPTATHAYLLSRTHEPTLLLLLLYLLLQLHLVHLVLRRAHRNLDAPPVDDAARARRDERAEDNE